MGGACRNKANKAKHGLACTSRRSPLMYVPSHSKPPATDTKDDKTTQPLESDIAMSAKGNWESRHLVVPQSAHQMGLGPPKGGPVNKKGRDMSAGILGAMQNRFCPQAQLWNLANDLLHHHTT